MFDGTISRTHRVVYNQERRKVEVWGRDFIARQCFDDLEPTRVWSPEFISEWTLDRERDMIEDEIL